MIHKRTFYGVQVLRGLAASMVVWFHVASNISDGHQLGVVGGYGFHSILVPEWGNAGVDLFFLISGFVIVWTTQDSWWRSGAWSSFLEKRITRIFPLYWILTTGKVLLILALPQLFRNSQLHFWNVIGSYLLIPSRNAEGEIYPIITAGWTLCFEMLFYYLCAVCMALGRRPIVVATPLFIILGILGAVQPPQWGSVTSLIDPLLLEFVVGMWIADLTQRGKVRGNFWLMLGIIMVGWGLWIASDVLPAPVEKAYRVLVWGLPAALVLYAVVALEEVVSFRRFKVLLLIGNASYSIYIAHTLSTSLAVNYTKHLILSPAREWAIMAAIVAFGIASGILVWWCIERQLLSNVLAYLRPRGITWAGAPGESYSVTVIKDPTRH